MQWPTTEYLAYTIVYAFPLAPFIHLPLSLILFFGLDQMKRESAGDARNASEAWVELMLFLTDHQSAVSRLSIVVVAVVPARVC